MAGHSDWVKPADTMVGRNHLAVFRIVNSNKRTLNKFLEAQMPDQYFFPHYAPDQAVPRPDIKMWKGYGNEGYKLITIFVTPDQKGASKVRLLLPLNPIYGEDEMGIHSVSYIRYGAGYRGRMFYGKREEQFPWEKA